MKHYFLFVFLIGISLASNSQTIYHEWDVKFIDKIRATPSKLIFDSKSNSYCVNTRLDSSNNERWAITKVNPYGDTINNFLPNLAGYIPNVAFDFILDSNDNLYIVGIKSISEITKYLILAKFNDTLGFVNYVSIDTLNTEGENYSNIQIHLKDTLIYIAGNKSSVEYGCKYFIHVNWQSETLWQKEFNTHNDYICGFILNDDYISFGVNRTVDTTTCTVVNTIDISDGCNTPHSLDQQVCLLS